MKKNCLLLFVISVLLTGCYKDYEGFGDISQCEGLQETIDKIKNSPIIDDKVLLETLQTTRLTKIDEYYKQNNGEWEYLPMLSSHSSTILCFDNEAYKFSKYVFDDEIKILGPYPLTYDADTNTFYTTSQIHHTEHKAVVKYFDGEIIILDGLFMPRHDMYNEDYAEYRYITTFRLEKEGREYCEGLL